MVTKRDNAALPGRPLRDDATVTVAFEMKAYVTGTRAQLATLHERASKALVELYAGCDENGTLIVQAFGGMRALRAEEAMAVIPRRVHMKKLGINGRQICSTAHVSEKYLTDDSEKVTCKLCIAEMKNGDRQ